MKFRMILMPRNNKMKNQKQPKWNLSIILGTCAGLICIILLAVYTVVQRRKKINIDLEENMAQSMKNLEAQNNLIEESEESTDNEDYTDNGQDVNPMKYKGSFCL